MPIAIARVDSSLTVSLNAMLAFMCLLWLMVSPLLLYAFPHAKTRLQGTANTVIYVCTRRLGPTPWHRRSASNSKSRTRSKSSRPEQSTNRGTGHTRGPSNAVGITTINGNHTGTLPIQIQIDKYTHATDDKFFDLAKERRESSNRSSFTGADVPAAPATAFSGYDSKPAAAFDSTRIAFEPKRSFEGARPVQPQVVDRPQHTRAESFNSTFAPVRRESKVGFDFGDVPTGTRHAIRQNSISNVRTAGTTVPSAPGVIVQTYPRPPKPPFYQNPQDSASFSYQPPITTVAPQPVIPPVEQQQIHEYEEEPHPYSRAQSPSQRVRPLPPTPEPTSISKVTRVHEHRLDPGAYNSYYYDDTDDDVSPRSADFGNIGSSSGAPHHTRMGSVKDRAKSIERFPPTNQTRHAFDPPPLYDQLITIAQTFIPRKLSMTHTHCILSTLSKDGSISANSYHTQTMELYPYLTNPSSSNQALYIL
ncbi:10662_t:CDS:2 [Acaulospora colombiana]|uniref:10662_t:CDS:1 n=1 Tax=Acaulospora colombiana TaxID=27376 RepID=A0ACA9NS26_9GLOM|nr:10662_t:CDS:2 [Acaulospora colombiana]